MSSPPSLPPPLCKECPHCGFAEHPDMTCEEYEDEVLRSYSVYLMQSGSYFKIGWTRSDRLRRRLHNLSIGNPHHKLKIVHQITLMGKYSAKEWEKLLHQKFSHKRRTGEWFALNKNDIKYICAIYHDMANFPTVEDLDAVVAEVIRNEALCKPFLRRRVRHKERGDIGFVEGEQYGTLIIRFPWENGWWRDWCDPSEVELATEAAS